MLNRIILIGRLTKDPELRYTQSGTAVCSFALAVDSGYGDNKRTDFIDIVVWSKAGESCAQYLAKGKLAAVEGRLQLRSYEDKNGNKRRATEVVAENVKFLTPRNEGATGRPPAGDDRSLTPTGEGAGAYRPPATGQYTDGEWGGDTGYWPGTPDADLPF